MKVAMPRFLVLVLIKPTSFFAVAILEVDEIDKNLHTQGRIFCVLTELAYNALLTKVTERMY